MISEVIILITTVAFGSWLYVVYRRPLRFPPGPLGVPILGSLPFLGAQPHVTLCQLSKKYGKIFSIYYGSYPVVVLNHPELIRDAFKRDVFSGRPNFLLAMAISKEGITFNDGVNGMEQRRFAMKTLKDFGFGKQSMEKSIQEEVEKLVEFFKKFVNSRRNKKEKPVELRYIFGLSVVNALWAMLVGEKFSLDDAKVKKIYEICIEGFIDPPVAGALWFLPWIAKVFPNWSGYNAVLKAMKSLENLVAEAVERHKKNFQSGVHNDFIDVYLDKIAATIDENSSFHERNGEKSLVHVLIDLFAAGSDTLNSSLNFAFLYLCTYPEMMERIQSEIDEVVGTERMPEPEDRKKMPFTDRTISEIFRLSSIVTGSILHSTTEDFEFHGYFLPKGTIVMANLYNVHHDKEYWGDPENFRPDRFKSEAGRNKKAEALMPFSTGKRVCIAENMAQVEFFLFLAGILQKFHVYPDPSSNLPDFVPLPGLVLSPKPYKAIFKQRN